jgi:hypothetical protein
LDAPTCCKRSGGASAVRAVTEIVNEFCSRPLILKGANICVSVIVPEPVIVNVNAFDESIVPLAGVAVAGEPEIKKLGHGRRRMLTPPTATTRFGKVTVKVSPT